MPRPSSALLGTFATLCAVSLVAGLAIGAAAQAAPPSTLETPTPTATEDPGRATATALGAGLGTCSVTEYAADDRLAEFGAVVRDADTGAVLFQRNPTVPLQTASVMKVLTAAAALTVLGPDYRVPTTVVKGDQPGTVVLVGGGDITLASGDRNLYPGAATMADLARQVRAAWDADPNTAGSPITTVIVDATLFAGESWHPSWERKEQIDGYSSEVTALQVDGDRAAPLTDASRRSDDPVARAADVFLGHLGVNATLVQGVAPVDAQELARVESAPLRTLIPDMLLRSDNTAAEMLARLTAHKLGAGSSFESLSVGIPLALQRIGIDTSGLVIADGSGLSPDNGVSPTLVTALMNKVYARQGDLGVILDGLPVAGQSGTLSYRFTGEASEARGAVAAKTGWIDTANALAGVITAQDGTALTFSFQSVNSVRDPARQAIDELAAAVYRCGRNLANT